MPSKKHQSPIESNNAFMVKIEDLVREIVIQNSIPHYRIESRMEHHSLAGGEDIYLPVIRIITYFEDTVSQISDIIRDEFDIAIEKSIDKKKVRIDSFSYKHVQYIAGLKENRRELTEYRRSGNKKFEIQVCSMLQDAWTGIEKELGYDDSDFPEETKRDFYRVGALLEMADIEFCKIRSLLDGREKTPFTAIQRPEIVIVNDAKGLDDDSFTFSEHLQTVNSEEIEEEEVAAAIPAPQVKAEAPRVEAEKIPVKAEPVAEVPKVAPVPEVKMPEPVAEVKKPEPVAEVVAPAPPPVPVVEAKPVVQEIVAAAPVAEPQPKAAPVPEPKTKSVNVFASFISSLVPVRAVAAKAPAGLAPVRMKVPVVNLDEVEIKPSANGNKANTITLANTVSLVNNQVKKEEVKVAEVVNKTERFTEVVNSVAPVVKEPVAVVEQVIPAFVAAIPAPPPPPLPVVEIPVVQYAPPVPVAEPKKEPVPEPVVAESRSTMGVNVNGMVEKVAEVMREPERIPERIPERPQFFEDEEPKAKSTVLDENAPMNDATLREYVMNSKLLKEVDQKIAERAGAKINAEIDIEGDVERLRFLKVFTLKQLHDRITDNKNDIVSFAEKWIGKDNGGSFDSGISLFYLEYLLVGKKNDPAFAIEYVVKFISDNDYSARYIIPTYNSIRNTEVSNFSHLTLKV